MGAEATLTIRDLVERTQVPATTIHHYQRVGLLPAPQRLRSNRFGYDERHVQALLLIRLLRERRRLPLSTIGRVLPQLLTDEEHAFRAEMWERVIAAETDEVAARTRTAILTAARDAFAAHGFADASVASICASVGIAKGSCYEHFASKETLFAEATRSLVDDVVTEFMSAKGGTPLTTDEAVRLLDAVLEPQGSLLAEALLRARFGKHDDAQIAPELARLHAAVEARLVGSTRARRATAARVVESALGRMVAAAAARGQ